MDIKDFRISRDGETVAVYKLGINQKTGEETARPVAYVRDLLDALLSVQRKMTVEQLDSSKDMKELMVLLKQQQDGLISLVKSNCRECLK